MLHSLLPVLTCGLGFMFRSCYILHFFSFLFSLIIIIIIIIYFFKKVVFLHFHSL